MDNQKKEKLVKAILKAIAYAENGGKPNVNNLKAGKTGERKSMYQFTPATWENYAQQVLGDKNAPLTPENEILVAHKKIADWVEDSIKSGVPEQEIASRIASIWNAGQGEPNAYKGTFSNGQPSKGINKKYNVAFDVPGYSNKVKNYTKEFLTELDKETPTIAQQPVQPQQGEKDYGTKALSFLSERIKSMATGGISRASAQEQPSQQNSANMPLMGSPAPTSNPLAPMNSQNMPLMQQALQQKKVFKLE